METSVVDRSNEDSGLHLKLTGVLVIIFDLLVAACPVSLSARALLFNKCLQIISPLVLTIRLISFFSFHSN